MFFEVFPYYGIALAEEITLFAPYALLLCLPISDNFQSQILQNYTFWSEQSLTENLLLDFTLPQLNIHLKKFLLVFILLTVYVKNQVHR
jgi:hypothetical protein